MVAVGLLRRDGAAVRQGGFQRRGETGVSSAMHARRTLRNLHRGILSGFVLAALLCGCDVMGGGPSVAPPSNTAIPTPVPTATPSVIPSPTFSPASSARKANGAGIR